MLSNPLISFFTRKARRQVGDLLIQKDTTLVKYNGAGLCTKSGKGKPRKPKAQVRHRVLCKNVFSHVQCVLHIMCHLIDVRIIKHFHQQSSLVIKRS